jgi:nucleoside-triphosphatase
MLTGAPGAGKTTLVCRIAAELQASGLAVAGFTSRELRERSGRVGFQVEAIGGASAVMAHVGFTEGPRVGRYRVDVPAFERIALPAIERATRAEGVAVIDELGPMELYSDAFVHAVQHLFDQDVPVVATVHARSHPLTDALRQRPGIEQLTVTRAAHEELLARVSARLLGAPGGMRRPIRRMKSLVRKLDRPAVCGLGEGCPDGLDADRLFRRADPLVAPGGFRQQVAIVPRLVTDTATTMLSALLTWAPPSPTARTCISRAKTGSRITQPSRRASTWSPHLRC